MPMSYATRPRTPCWAPWPTAKAYGLKSFTFPDGKPTVESLYDALAHRGLDGRWEYDFFSNEKVTDEIAGKTGLDKISSRQTGREDMQRLRNELQREIHERGQAVEALKRSVSHAQELLDSVQKAAGNQ